MAKGKDDKGVSYGGYEEYDAWCAVAHAWNESVSKTCISNYDWCAFYNSYTQCKGCYSSCIHDYEANLAKWCETNCNTCDTGCHGGCVSKYESGTQETKRGCQSTYGVCDATCDACESCQGCVECQSFDKAQDAQSSLIKNVDESVTRRARGEGYSKAAANMIGAGSAQDSTAQNFNSLAMAQNAMGNSTQADWLTKQGYLDALDKEIENKQKSGELMKQSSWLDIF